MADGRRIGTRSVGGGGLGVDSRRRMARIGIVVVAYNAASTLEAVLDRIPHDFRERVTAVLVSDDASHDDTYAIGLDYQASSALPLTVIRQERNRGYGGNQKECYRWAIEHDLDIVVLLHGDGQYAPECLPEIVAPLEAGEADAVFGSRILVRGAARKGGMPLYKFVGNRILSTVQNLAGGTNLSEWHSGYRAYSVEALRAIPFERNVDGFNFDTQIICQLLEADRRIVEVPIPTYYGDEICYVDGIPYGLSVLRDVARYRLHKLGFGSGEMAFASEQYESKLAQDSSHDRVVEMVGHRSPGRVLDLGCGDGTVGAALMSLGHEVVGVDLDEAPGVRDRLAGFVKADLDQGLPSTVGDGFDAVVAADVFEHLRQPEELLVRLHEVVDPEGVIVTSIPNIAHWYPRVRVLLGRFDYDRRGILDRTHLRFFTRRSFERMARSTGWEIERLEWTGLPLGIVERGDHSDRAVAGSPVARMIAGVDRALVRLWPTLFGYQMVAVLRRSTGDGAPSGETDHTSA